MKQIALITVIALSGHLAIAEPNQDTTSPGDVNPTLTALSPTDAARSSGFKDSHTALYETYDIDGSQPNEFAGTTVPSGPTRISLYEAYRDSPEGTGYSDYFDRFPASASQAEIASQQEVDGAKI